MTFLSRRAFLGASIAALAASPRPGLAQEALALRPPLRQIPDAEALIARAGLAGRVSCAVSSAEGQELLDQAAAGAPTPPASTMKVLTALYALDRLGVGYRFRTRVLRVGDMLVLAGGGDPLLSTDDLARLAADLVATGQPSPARFAVWGGALPQMSRISPAQADYLAYNPALSGMILNFNRVHLGWRRVEGSYRMSLEARAAAHSPRAYTVTAQPATQRPLFAYRTEGGRESWTVSRQAMGRAGSRWLPVRQPELYAGDVFQTLCRAKGLVLPAPEMIDSLPPAEELVALESPPLREILQGMLHFSTNLTAEVVGLRASQAANPAASAKAMQGWLAARGLGQGFILGDHSGLSAESRVTAAGMVQILAGPGIAAGLPDLLKQDPLRDGLGEAASGQARIAAKTGTLNFVSNLAGYAQGPKGARIPFAVLCVDSGRHAATLGQELPAGVSTWTRAAKLLQHDLIESWASRFA